LTRLFRPDLFVLKKGRGWGTFEKRLQLAAFKAKKKMIPDTFESRPATLSFLAARVHEI
jgi:hypothetical protein